MIVDFINGDYAKVGVTARQVMRIVLSVKDTQPLPNAHPRKLNHTGHYYHKVRRSVTLFTENYIHRA